MSFSSTVHFLDSMENVQRNIHEVMCLKGFWGGEEIRCPHCGGEGQSEAAKMFGPDHPLSKCPLCHGHKVIWKVPPDHLANRNFGECLMLAVTELSEALEKHRQATGKGLPDKPDEYCPQHGGLQVEIVDCMIRLLDLAEAMKMDTGRILLDKMAYNKSRPPRHGKAY